MHSFLIQSGDLVIGSHNRLLLADYQQKLIQDLNCWFLESFGEGFTTPNFGSLLDTYIGGVDPQSLVAQVQGEVQRLLGLYQGQQIQLLKQAQSRNQLSNWAASQVIQSIGPITTSAVGTQITVDIQITTAQGAVTPINLTVTPQGVNLS